MAWASVCAVSGHRPLYGLLPVAGGLPAGHDGPHHVYPCAFRMAFHDVLLDHGCFGAGHAGLATSAGRCLDPRSCSLGAVFTALALATGSLWGKPMWGTWWVWDARLTSVFVLFLMYLGIIALSRAMDDPTKSAKPVAVLTLVGFINIPIIKFSVDWWNTLHQPASVFRMDGPTIDASMLRPLFVMAIGFTLLFLTLHMMAMRNEICAAAWL